ncbi:MAG: hypothetical protein ACRDI2_26135 [Chloroflexota bacterium]
MLDRSGTASHAEPSVEAALRQRYSLVLRRLHACATARGLDVSFGAP